MILSLGVGNISFAAELDENMQVLAENMSILESSKDKNELLKALDMMSEAVDDSMKTLPEKISTDDKKAQISTGMTLNFLKMKLLQ